MTDIKEIEWEDMGWINLAQDRVKWQAVVNVVMKFQVHIMLGISWLAKELLASPEGLCSILSVSQQSVN